MATVDQIKQLIKHHYERSDEKFRTTVLQIAASEAKLGHTTQARELKDLLDKIGKGVVLKFNSTSTLFDISLPCVCLDEMVVSSEITERINRVLVEYKQREKLNRYGLNNRRKILLEGPSGTGKTMTASVIAHELSMSLFTIQMDKVISKFMGETSTKLRQLFESIEQSPGVYLFDEFDAIGADRAFDNEVGEMRRVLNAFLQLLENDSSDSIIIAATNNNQLLDQALYRRFDDVLHYHLPTEEEVVRLFEIKLGSFFGAVSLDNETISAAIGLSQAEISKICEELVKAAILQDQGFSTVYLHKLISERSGVYKHKEA